MAQNENPSLDAEFCFVSGITGAGKSQMVGHLKRRFTRKGFTRWVQWDPDNDHKGKRFTDASKTAFLRALSDLMKGRSGSICYSPDNDSKEEFQWFCRAVWSALDGRKKLGIIIEEAADLELGAGKIPGFAGKIQRRGRKYGALLIAGTQRIQEVPKPFITQAKYRYIGQQLDMDAKYCNRLLGIPVKELEALPPLTFFLKVGSTITKEKIKYV